MGQAADQPGHPRLEPWPTPLVQFQDLLLRRATEFRDSHTRMTEDGKAFVDAVQTGWALALHCAVAACEDDIKAVTAATPRCIPVAGLEVTGQCVRCDRPAACGKRVVFGRAY